MNSTHHEASHKHGQQREEKAKTYLLQHRQRITDALEVRVDLTQQLIVTTVRKINNHFINTNLFIKSYD